MEALPAEEADKLMRRIVPLLSDSLTRTLVAVHTAPAAPPAPSGPSGAAAY